MKHVMSIAAVTALTLLGARDFGAPADSEHPAVMTEIHYLDDGQMQLPQDYRRWTYLSTGFDMSYNPLMRMGHHMFDNVFVQPKSYDEFLRTGSWPDKTVLIMEVRGADEHGSINKAGAYESEGLMGLEAHVKDAARFPGGWGFFVFTGDKGVLLPQTAECYSCHRQHGAVDTTFVQFYPTLLPAARANRTLSEAVASKTAH